VAAALVKFLQASTFFQSLSAATNNSQSQLLVGY
jgi:hypothetical protein